MMIKTCGVLLLVMALWALGSGLLVGAPADRAHALLPGEGWAVPADDGNTIRVLVVYTQAARLAAGGVNQIENHIQQAAGKTLQSFIESEIEIDLVLAGMREIAYAETGDLGADLNALQNPADGIIDVVHAWRDDEFADLVSLVVAWDDDDCYQSRHMALVGPAFAAQAFSVVRFDCLVDRLGFPMALGRNLGARLDWFTDDGVLPFTDSHGHIYIPEPVGSQDGWRTVMTTDGLCTAWGVYCEHLWRWSNPQLRYGVDGPWMGVPAGTNISCWMGVDNNPPCDADNARVLNQTAGTVANFRVGAPPPPTAVPAWDSMLPLILAP
jgi:peptidyl-Asp metalloendopeptidase